jgi:hypothetical protein
MDQDVSKTSNANSLNYNTAIKFVGISSGASTITLGLNGLSGTATDTILSYTTNTDETITISSGIVRTTKLVVKTSEINAQEWQTLSGNIVASINNSGYFAGFLASGVVNSESVLSGSIGTNQLASGVLQSVPANIQSGQITSGYLGNSSVNNININSGTIANDKLANNTITIAGSSTALGGFWDAAALTTSSGLLAGTFYPSGALTIGIASGGLLPEMFGSGSVLSGSIASGQIGPNHLSSGALGIAGTSGMLQFNNGGVFGATSGLNYSMTSGNNFVHIQAQTAFNTTLAVKAASGQITNLQSWTNTSGSALAYMDASGNFFAVSKSFLINHPNKPGKKLRHVSLEGPSADVYYRGKSKSNTFVLPDYWKNLVDENNIDIILIPIGSKQSLYVEKIENLIVHVGGCKKPYYTFLAIAERIDMSKIVVEE